MTETKPVNDSKSLYIKAIYNLAIDLASISTSDNFFEFLAERLKLITGAIVTAVSIYDSGTKEIVVKYISTESYILSKVNTIIGKKIMGMRMPVSPDLKKRMLNEIVARPANLNELTFGAISKPVSALLHQLFNIGSITGVALQYNNEIEGSIGIIMPKNKPTLPIEVMETLAEVIALALKCEKLRTESLTEKKKSEESLKAKNIALKEVLDQITTEKSEIKENMKKTMEKLILPQLDKLKRKVPQSKLIVENIEKNIESVSASFGRKISTNEIGLSAREIEVCDMIRNSFKNKTIAKELGISLKTVETIRKNIRKKLKITNQSVNLRSYLQSL